MILFSTALCGSLKNADLYPSCIVFFEFGRSFKSLADTSSGIQVTNMFILIHGYCLQAMYISLVNEASVSFWRKCMSYEIWNHKTFPGLSAILFKTKTKYQTFLASFPKHIVHQHSSISSHSSDHIMDKYFLWSNKFLEASHFS